MDNLDKRAEQLASRIYHDGTKSAHGAGFYPLKGKVEQCAIPIYRF